MRQFTQFACIDWSGAATERTPSIALAVAEAGRSVRLVTPDGGWSRAKILHWLRDRADDGDNMLIGLDLSPALPFADTGAYFPGWSESPADALALWALVDRLCADDPHFAASSFIAHPEAQRHFRQRSQRGDLFSGTMGRLRVVEHGQAELGLRPYSCFNLVGAAQVGKSSLTGMRVLHQLRGHIPVWPFDPVPRTGPVIVEIYTSLAALAAGRRVGRTKVRDAAGLSTALAALGAVAERPIRIDDHATDALMTAAWLRSAAGDPALWSPRHMTDAIAATEGWTFGVP
jgi:hypothetical protein